MFLSAGSAFKRFLALKPCAALCALRKSFCSLSCATLEKLSQNFCERYRYGAPRLALRL
ncbi:hypothetical protein [Campylobacter sp.]|uniref:hypothetical protein n=1 Tax=Campylobacter sp. TaxID=205 RepID=UPI002A822D2B|nr:hypothetical protein [Campylobacter sp.]MDY4802897.1 hypothetical protein [Campylobacter sp.]